MSDIALNISRLQRAKYFIGYPESQIVIQKSLNGKFPFKKSWIKNYDKDIFPACKKVIPKYIGVNEDGEIFPSPISSWMVLSLSKK